MLLKNVKCMWASVIEPNTKYDDAWEIVAILDDKQTATLADIGFKIKQDEDGNNTYRFVQKCQGTKKTGEKFEYKAPNVLGADKKEFTKLIGNGSIVNIQYNIKETVMLDQTFIKGALVGVQVLKHVPFGEDDEFEVEGETTSIADPTEAVIDIDEDDIPF